MSIQLQPIEEKYFQQDFCNNVCPDGMSITDIQVLPFNDRYIGSTDYIDGIYPLDMKYRVMIGVDRYKRPFISLKIDEKNVQTFFQRYSDNTNCWSHGKIGSNPLVECSGNTLRQTDEMEKIKMFIQKNIGIHDE